MTLKEIRVSRGMTQTDVSVASGIAQGNYCSLEKANRMSAKTARKLAPVFGLRWYELMDLISGEPDHNEAN